MWRYNIITYIIAIGFLHEDIIDSSYTTATTGTDKFIMFITCDSIGGYHMLHDSLVLQGLVKVTRSTMDG